MTLTSYLHEATTSERYSTYNPTLFIELYNQRLQIAQTQKPTNNQTANFLIQKIPLERDFIHYSYSNTDEFVKALHCYKNFLTKQDGGITPTDSQLCAEAIKYLVLSPLQQSADYYFQEGKYIHFILLFDYLYGISLIPSSILLATDNPNAEAELIYLGQLLKKDHTSKTLIKQIVKELNNESYGESVPYQRILECQDPVEVLGGARFAGFVFGCLFDIVKKQKAQI